MSGKWLIAIWIDDRNGEFKAESSEVRGRFETDETRNDAETELREEDPHAKIVVIPIDVEGDDEASLEISSV